MHSRTFVTHQRQSYFPAAAWAPCPSRADKKMPLPIPVGGISTSSLKIPGPVHHVEDENDNGPHHATIQRRAQHLHQSIAFASCPSKEWQARVVTSFYDVIWEHHKSDASDQETANGSGNMASNREKTMVEIRIQVSPLSSPLSMQRFRETSYHLKLMDDAHNPQYPHSMQPRVVFSQDRRYLVVLLFHPHRNTSTVIVFQLRRPRHHNVVSSSSPTLDRRPAIPLPSYIIKGTSIRDAESSSAAHGSHAETPPISPAVATNPKFVSVWGITAMCPIPSLSAKISESMNPPAHETSTVPTSILMAACQDGTLVWIDLKSAQPCAKGRLPVLSLHTDGSSPAASSSEEASSSPSSESISDASESEGSKSDSIASSSSSSEPAYTKSESSAVTFTSGSTGILPITSMQASPTSCLESGTVALVTSAVDTLAQPGTSRTRSVECVVASWSFDSTTPKQRTLQKRASTGTVSIETSPRRNMEDTTPVKAKPSKGRGLFQQTTETQARHAPTRTLSDTLQTLLKTPTASSMNRKDATNVPTRKLQIRKGGDRQQAQGNSDSSSTKGESNDAAFSRSRFIPRSKSMEKNASEFVEKLSRLNITSMGTLGRSDDTASEEDREAKALQQRKLFVLQELQRGSLSGQWPENEQYQSQSMEDWNPSNKSHSERNPPSRSDSGSNLVSPPSKSSEPSTSQSDALEKNALTQYRLYPRRRSNPDKSGTHKSLHGMKVEVLSTWSGSAGNNDGEHQHLNSKKAVVDVCFGPLSTVLCVLYKSTATEMERRQRVAQVLTISESGNLSPVSSLFLSLEQVQQASCLERWTSSDTVAGKCSDSDVGASTVAFSTVAHSCIGLEYVPGQGSFVVNSFFGGKERYWVGCIWNWRDDSLGWLLKTNTLRNAVWNKLYYCDDPLKGSQFVKIEVNVGKEETAIAEAVKRAVSVATLSPSNTRGAVSLESHSLVLSSRSVGIPLETRNDADAALSELEWKTTSLPASYISSYGSPKVAVIGPTYSKSVAVASNHGLCIWDVNIRQKWKRFGSPAEERSFTVLGMVWWEGRRTKNPTIKQENDLLIAIIRTKTGHQYLSCWSSKRLDLAHQLLDNPHQYWQIGETQDLGQSWGMPLPHDIQVSEMSLLSEPGFDEKHGRSSPRKAVLAIYSADSNTSEFEYKVFCLQVAKAVSKKKTNDAAGRKKHPFFVMAHETLSGRFRNDTRSVGPVSTIFLAGSSFRFDFRNHRKKSIDLDTFFVTLGVVRTPGGLEGIYIGADGSASVSSVEKTEISKFWLSDLVHSNTLLGSLGPPVSEFAWIVRLTNGELLCWCVPSLMPLSPEQSDKWEVKNEETTEFPKGLRIASIVCKNGRLSKERRQLLGTYCALGKVSDWIQQASSDTQSMITMGHVPGSKFGCILQSGPDATLYRFNKLAHGEMLQEKRIFCPGSFVMTPPAFVTSLYILALESAWLKIKTGQNNTNHDDDFAGFRVRYQIIHQHVQHRLSTAPNRDAVMMCLRLLVFRSIELVTKAYKVRTGTHPLSSEAPLLLSRELFAAVVDAVCSCTTALQFSSLFLEVGRQVEPSCLAHLFPLPENGRYKTRSLLELLTVCIDDQAFASSVSALPLLKTEASARYYCGAILDEVVDAFIRNTHSRHMRYDETEEARQVTGDIFQFGIKLEDADILESERQLSVGRSSKTDKDDDESLVSFGHTNGSRTTNDDDSLGFEETEKRSHLICGMNGSNPFLNYIVPSNMRGMTDKEREEEAIRREAQSFIKGSLDDPSLGFASLPNWDDLPTTVPSDGSDINSVAGLMGDALLDLLQSTRTDTSWKAMGALAKMLFPAGFSNPPSFECIRRLDSKVVALDVVAILPEIYTGQGDYESMIELYLSDEIHLCSTEITEAVARDLALTSLFIMDRLNSLPLPDEGDQTAMELGLVVILLVSGLRGGVSEPILEVLSSSESILRQSYENVLG